ncbi:RloB family protein [Accumulibacter sp.]|uniref:RloB family protein n=1 Tax=Accumulibacter sp. TaxID=2053492 RepID=UPI0025F4577E|nr:RloB family protein [Accumulibacter sp.]MCM8611552.1 RloB family protein [Accumulibacter sp.]MCM8635186.1 RloB family protein [Accumulibacter sp.]MCM8640468.1 RloB family protein [Accumulibacter sp.]
MISRRSAFRRTKRLFVIAAEGDATEPLYFAAFQPGRHGTFRLKVLDNPRHKTSPLEVGERLTENERRYQPGPDTEYWVVVDRDTWSEDELVAAWALIGRQRSRYHLALSNPCFELWLWLPLLPNRPFADCQDCCRSLAREWPGFRTKSHFDVAALVTNGNIADACKRARELDTDPRTPWPRDQTTRIHHLVESLR